jgi:hypothetical protein
MRKRAAFLTSNLIHLLYRYKPHAYALSSYACTRLSYVLRIGYLGYQIAKAIISEKEAVGWRETVTYLFFDWLPNRLPTIEAPHAVF